MAMSVHHITHKQMCISAGKLDIISYLPMEIEHDLHDSHYERVCMAPRDKVDEQKWSLGYDHYALISKYIYDYKTAVNFVKVCSRTSGLFHMHKNLGVNIKDMSDWPKMQTHVIYTDREEGIPFFNKDVNKCLFGTYHSFRTYFNNNVFFYYHFSLKKFIVLFSERIFPVEFIDIITAFIKVLQDNINGHDNEKTVFSIGNGKHIKFANETRMHFYADRIKINFLMVHQNVYRSCMKAAHENKGLILAIKMYKIISAVITGYIKPLSDMFFKIDNTYSTKVTLCGVQLPYIHNTYTGYEDDSILEGIFKAAKKIDSIYSVTTACPLSVSTVKRMYEQNRLHDIDIDKTILVLKVESYASGYKKQFNMVYLPKAYFNHIIIRCSDMIVPINLTTYYIKGTSDIISTLENRIIEFYEAEDSRMIKFHNVVEHTLSSDSRFYFSFCQKYKSMRFISAIEVYSIDGSSYMAGSTTKKIEYAKELAKEDLSLLALKYGYKTEYCSGSYEEGFIYDDKCTVTKEVGVLMAVYGFEKKDIRSIVYDKHITHDFCMYGGDYILKVDSLPRGDYAQTDYDYPEDMMYFYVDGTFMTLAEVLEKGDAKMIKTIEDTREQDHLLEFIISGKSEDMLMSEEDDEDYHDDDVIEID